MRRDNLSAIGPSPSNPIFMALPGGWWAPVTICNTLPNASSLLTSHQVLPMSMSARWPVFMILTCDGDVRDRFQSVMDGVAVAGGGRPGSAAREGEPDDYTVIPLLFLNPFLPLPTTFVSLLHPAFPRHHPFYVCVSYSPASSSFLIPSFSLSSSLICSSYCFPCFISFTLFMTFIRLSIFSLYVLFNCNIGFHSLNHA